jgi:hypothetical protein
MPLTACMCDFVGGADACRIVNGNSVICRPRSGIS